MPEDIYAALGVSSGKEAINKAAKGAKIESIVPNSFAIIKKDKLTGNPDYGVSVHADGIGSGNLTHYMYAKETDDPSEVSSVPAFAVVMNTDDIGCSAPLTTGYLVDTIARNPFKTLSKNSTAFKP